MSDDEGFLSRWSRRKVQRRRGEGTEPAPPVADAASVPTPPAPAAATAAPAVEAPVAEAQHPEEPPPTLDDVARLPADAADFSRFVAPRVDPQVRNAAMKKLFSDPHFNVMDGLDVYIDDYSQPDPLPLGMLRQLTQSRLLGLVTDEPEADAAAGVPAPALAAAAVDNAAHEADLPPPPADAPADAPAEPSELAAGAEPPVPPAAAA